MDCVMVRHGIAIAPDEWDGPDEARPLTPKGIEKTKEAAQGLAVLKLRPTHMLVSPYVRAKETAKLLKEALDFRGDLRTCDELTPAAHPDKLLVLLNGLPSHAVVLCVGHEPHLGQSAGVILFGEPVPGLAFKKAGACLLMFDGPAKAGRGSLGWWLAPAQLRALAKD